MLKKLLLILSIIFSINLSFAKENLNADDIRKQISDYAMKYIDTPYRWGSNGPKNFDCSGFVNYIYQNKANIDLPRISSDISKIGPSKTRDLQIGDLVFFKTTKKERISHVGIYIGNGKFIHASSGKKKVVVSTLEEGYYKKAFRWAVNVLENK